MLDLNEIRTEIDGIDSKIVELFETRMEKCEEVAQYKISTGKPVLDRKREQDKINTLKKLASTPFNEQAVAELFGHMMAISRKRQYQLLVENNRLHKLDFYKVEALETKNCKVAYAGVPGAYAHAAMIQYFGEDVNGSNVSTFRQVLEEVESGRADYGVIPIENTTAGAVTDAYDSLLEAEVYIVAQTDVQINHALLGLPGSTIADIKTVYSHPQGLMQSAQFLETHPQWNRISMSNTAVSAKKVIEMQDSSCAAIASVTAAKIYGLDVLQEHLNISNQNTTRFFIVSRKNQYSSQAKRTCLSFEIPHEKGSLYEMLSHFIYNGVNMSKIESRPVPGENWSYRFVVELEGRIDETGVVNALQGVGAEAHNVKILGCY
jgi:chorismate mutase/prephenate dehydratase